MDRTIWGVVGGAALALLLAGDRGTAQDPGLAERMGRLEKDVAEIKKDVKDVRTMLLRFGKAAGIDLTKDQQVPRMRSRIGTNESSAIGSLRSLSTAQEQFKQQAVVDQDGDGMGEYGWLGELSGLDACRVTGLKMNTSPFIAAILGVKDSQGISQKSGYMFRVYLPTADGPARAESRTADQAVAADANHQEVRWICYAWPNSRGQSGNRTFMVNHAGDVYATSANTTKYSGTDVVPKAEAALDTEGLNPKNVDAGVGLAAAGLRSCDGNIWVPAGN